MDTLDGPYVSMKERKSRSKTAYQSELQMKLNERRKMGLAYDMTSEESEDTRDDGLDSEEEHSLTMEYRKSKRTDRPSSAKRRSATSLENTLRAGDANRFLKSSKPEKTPAVRGASPSSVTDKSPRFSRSSPSQEEISKMFGSSPKSRTSPKEEGIFGRTLQSPVSKDKYKSSSSSELPKTLPGGDRKSPLQKEMSKEELIFGRKTPTSEDREKSTDWKAPSFRKASPTLDSDRSQTPTETSKGRRTPVDSGLQSITESPRPQPRQRHGSKESQLRTRETSPKSLSIETSPRDTRAKPKVDIFGRKEREVNLSDEEDVPQKPRERRRFGDTGRKTPPVLQKGRQTVGRQTPPGQQTPTGRKTPTEKQGSTGRKTPTGLASGRKTPTGKHTSFDLRDEKEREGRQKKEPGLFDFIVDDNQTAEKPKPRLRKERSTEGSIKKSVSHDSITDELGVSKEQPSMLEASIMDSRIEEDQSSVCADVDKDPQKAEYREKQRTEQLRNQKQRSDRQEADDIIASVEDAQTTNQFKTIQKERPASAKSKDSVHKPKPRHSLPGSTTSDASVDAFNSTTSIRQAIFEEWKKKRDIELKRKKAEQKKKEEEEKKKKEKEAQDKILESKASYNAWMKERGTSFVKEKHKKLKEEDHKEKEKEREKLQKQKDAIMNFKKWKENKDEKLLEEHKKKIEEKHRKLQEERLKKGDKEKQNSTAFDGWKKKKDKILEENEIKKKENEQKAKKELMQTQKQKENEALKEYNEWMQKKEQQKTMEIIKKKHHSDDDFYDEYKPAWSPASKIIPYRR